MVVTGNEDRMAPVVYNRPEGPGDRAGETLTPGGGGRGHTQPASGFLKPSVLFRSGAGSLGRQSLIS